MPAAPVAPADDTAFTAALVADLDHRVRGLLAAGATDLGPLAHRETTARLKGLVTAYSHPRSAHHHDDRLPVLAARLGTLLAAAQTPSGLFDSTNLASPPDTAFTVNDLCLTAELAGREPALADLAAGLRAVAGRTLPPLLTGGVHTPNHRWELSSALARLGALLGAPEAVRGRVEEWLAEGVDLQEDGMYSERSPLYAGAVTSPSLLVIADLLDRPDLLDPVRRNLEAFLPLLDEDGALESVHSRRQDQHTAGHPGAGLLLAYRRFALAEDRGDLADAARLLQSRGLDGRSVLPEVLAHPALGGVLPAGTGRAWAGEAVLAASGLAVHAAGRTRTVVSGGSDQPAVGTIRSGTANTATFLRFRHGAAVLESVRLSTAFFGLGPFRSATLERDDDGALVLRQELRAGYYQPLPAADRDPTGTYPLGDEGRFHAAMAFERRAVDPVELTTTVRVALLDDGADLTVELAGAATSYALELSFRPGGVLSGADPVADGGRVLTGPELRYAVGEDEVVLTREGGAVGAGGEHQPARYDGGEQYDYLQGSHAAGGERVYLTGRTPGVLRLRLRGGRAAHDR
ncbi:hypothetical protein AB2L28_06740 [Kineococcus sp. TBRC 1896]|uniref:Heparinase II/III-like protein n=1 Tax=Kineococcus mangrovi TaxID=1660183 RepID=A0ABV4HZT5_9ACTN